MSLSLSLSLKISLELLRMLRSLSQDLSRVAKVASFSLSRSLSSIARSHTLFVSSTSMELAIKGPAPIGGRWQVQLLQLEAAGKHSRAAALVVRYTVPLNIAVVNRELHKTCCRTCNRTPHMVPTQATRDERARFSSITSAHFLIKPRHMFMCSYKLVRASAMLPRCCFTWRNNTHANL